MPRPLPFRNKKTAAAGGGGGADGDDMTIASSRSTGDRSVSDRIMGRMKVNLSSLLPGGRGGAGGGAGVGGSSSRSLGNHDNYQDDFDDADRRRRRRRATVEAGGGAVAAASSSKVGTTRGGTGGERRRSCGGGGGGGGGPPVEYSIEELRSMAEDELRVVMRYAGVSLEGLSKTKGTTELRRNSLVRIFIESGRVKLFPDGATTANASKQRPDATTTTTTRTSTASTKATSSSRIISDDVGEEGAESPIQELSFMSSATNVAGNDGEERSSMSRMSKLEKIAELKTENSNLKTENRSLKKTVKKLLGQLTDAITEKNELLHISSRKLQQQEQQEQQQRTSPVDGDTSTHEDDTPKKALPPLSPIQKTLDNKVGGHAVRPPRDGKDGDEVAAPVGQFSIPHLDGDNIATAVSSEIRSRPSDALASADSEKSMASSSSKDGIHLLKQKLRKEKHAHENTEVRLKAEMDILTNEVKGLQRELGLALRSLDDAKEREIESRESSHGLRRELRDVKARLKESAAEAEARDRLIETFKGILLQKVGLPQ